MMIARTSALSVLASTMFGLSVLSASAEELFYPTPTFVTQAQARLGMTPQDITVSGAFAYVLGVTPAGRSQIEMRDASSLKLINSESFEFAIEDIVADPDGTALYAIGHRGSASHFAVMDPDLRRLGAVTIKPRVGHPTLTINPDDLVAVSGLRTDYSEGFFAAVDVRNPNAPVLRDDFYASDARRGVMNGWIDARFGVLFLNAGWDSRVLAVATGKSYVMSEFGVRSSNSRLNTPYAITAQSGRAPCSGRKQTSFLIADMTRNEVSLLDFNEVFQSLDLLSFVEFRLSAVKVALRPLEGTRMLEPAGLIKASCDQSVILLGSKLSNELAQFSRNESLSSLERVGTIKLPGRPVGVAVDQMAGFAIVISDQSRDIIRLGASGDTGAGGDIIGDANIRELQRTLTEIGIPVGSIDGIMGAKTLRAVDLAERRFDVEIDAQGDILQSIEVLKDASQLR